MEQLFSFLSSPQGLEMAQKSALMFVRLFSELTILFLLISYLVAILNQKIPEDRIQKILGGKGGRGYLAAAGLGAMTPFCSCSTIPMLIGLLKARAGFGPTMTFLFTSPLLNPIVIVLFIPVLGWQATALYAGLALVVSILAGLVLQGLGFERHIKADLLGEPKNCCAQTQPTSCCGAQPKKEPSLWAKAFEESWSLFKEMFPYMLVAMVIGALVHGFVPDNFFASVAGADNPLAVPTASIIGIPLYIRVTALLPLVASFLEKGVSIGAIIALVIGSGGASLPEVILLKRLFAWPLLIAFLVVIFTMAVIGGYVFNFVLG